MRTESQTGEPVTHGDWKTWDKQAGPLYHLCGLWQTTIRCEQHTTTSWFFLLYVICYQSSVPSKNKAPLARLNAPTAKQHHCHICWIVYIKFNCSNPHMLKCQLGNSGTCEPPLSVATTTSASLSEYRYLYKNRGHLSWWTESVCECS